MLFYLVLSQYLSLQSTKKTNINQQQRAVLAQISINNINKISSDELLQRGATICKELETAIKVPLDLVLDEVMDNQSDSDPDNSFDFG